MVSGGAAPGERALHACDPSEACKREPCPRPLMLPASIAIIRRVIGGRALAAGAVRDGHERWTRTLFMYDLNNKLTFGRRGVSEERLYTQSG